MINNIGSYKVDGVEVVLWEDCHETFVELFNKVDRLEDLLFRLGAELDELRDE